MSMTIVSFAAGMLVAVAAVVIITAVIISRKIRQTLTAEFARARTEISELRTEITAVREYQEATKVKESWDASPLSELQFSEAQTVALLSSGSISLKWNRANLEGVIEHTPPLSTNETIGMFLEFVSDALHKTPDSPSIPVIIKFAGIANPLSDIHVTIGEKTLTSDFTKLLDAFSKFPELALASLMVIAHYFAGLENARKLSEINRKLDDQRAERRIDQRAKVEAIWVNAAAEVKNHRPTEASLTLFVVWRSKLYELRRVWEQEALHILQTTPPVPRWGRDGWSVKFFQHIRPCIELACLLQLALFTEYCMALAAGSLASFRHTLEQEKPRMVDIIATFRKHERTLGGTRMLGPIRDIGIVLEAYKNVLHGLTVLERVAVQLKP